LSGDGAEQGPIAPPTCWAALKHAGGDTGVLFGHVVQGDQGQRDEHQAEPNELTSIGEQLVA
jgi:hypothetical protein